MQDTDPSSRAVHEAVAVVRGEPSAVLLVNFHERSVVHANAVAQQLAPGVSLPIGLDAWSDAAQLRGPTGELLSDTEHPLSRAGQGLPVDGQTVTAARGSDMGVQRIPMRVVALPIQGAPVLEGHALVVMLPVGRGWDADERRDEWADLHSRAVAATGLSFTVADAGDPELPLVWVNPAFTLATGYELDDSLGRNCRFLQGPDTDRAVVAQIRDAVRAGEPITATLLNYRKDGTPFWNQVVISPVFGPGDRLTHFVGIQSDVTSKVEADASRDRALAAEQEARRAAESAERRLQLMADTSNQLSDALDPAEARRRLMSLLVPRVADYAVIFATGVDGHVETVLSEHADPSLADELERLSRALPDKLQPGSAAEVLLGPEGSRLLRDLDTPAGRGARRAYVADDDFVSTAAAFPTRSAVFVALAGRQDVREVLVLGRGPDRDQLDQHDLEDAIDLGRRAGLLLENIRLYETQRRNSEILQRSLLPDLPILSGIRSAARYHAGGLGAEVGGDFYELTAIDERTIGLAIGDVVGHDMLAAAAMGHLQGLVRACVHDPGATPGGVLRRVDTLLGGLRDHTVASMLQAFLCADDDGWEVTWSSAGHPPLVVRHPDGRTELLRADDGSGRPDNDVLLGVNAASPRRDHVVRLERGTVLLGYTDGLVERRGESIDLGLHRMLHQVSVGPPDPIGLVDHLVDTLTRGQGHEDDIALVAVLLEGR